MAADRENRSHETADEEPRRSAPTRRQVLKLVPYAVPVIVVVPPPFGTKGSGGPQPPPPPSG